MLRVPVCDPHQLPPLYSFASHNHIVDKKAERVIEVKMIKETGLVQ